MIHHETQNFCSLQPMQCDDLESWASCRMRSGYCKGGGWVLEESIKPREGFPRGNSRNRPPWGTRRVLACYLCQTRRPRNNFKWVLTSSGPLVCNNLKHKVILKRSWVCWSHGHRYRTKLYPTSPLVAIVIGQHGSLCSVYCIVTSVRICKLP